MKPYFGPARLTVPVTSLLRSIQPPLSAATSGSIVAGNHCGGGGRGRAVGAGRGHRSSLGGGVQAETIIFGHDPQFALSHLVNIHLAPGERHPAPVRTYTAMQKG
jgi:hypothetical protein